MSPTGRDLTPAEQAHRTLASGFWAVRELSEMVGGVDNHVFAAPQPFLQDLVVKVPRVAGRDRFSSAHWATEQCLRVGFPAPRVLRWAKGSCVETRIDGRALDADSADPAETLAAAIELGALLRRLHEVPVTGYGRLSPGGRGQHTSALTWLSAVRWPDGLDPDLAGRAKAMLRRFAPDLDGRPARLLHGDLTCGHVLIDGEGRVAGVVDWESVRGGDPWLELAGVSLRFPVELAEQVLHGYCPAGPDRAETAAMAVYRIRIAVALAAFHLERGEPAAQRYIALLAADLDDLDAGAPAAAPRPVGSSS
ncbi:hypothetical protein Lfu02_75400 [Longispora fulva]|uniref:Aminoglycoside phosphotransferase (APT) family kinase protein n=1 Tax=Longispora fulva TaxID=619741 RepID=A0A8J7G9M6_9ACTN|nr:aminoglycoside phosphotransferase family protein [Longispora fulva]MBG6136323.1 aminoglycoside phosphotransferase (APT) family kinase protein [Longispora fulva]GIG63168.1 hypothetical protein Lfu02_75400 [Longispora fulva]